MTDSTVWRILLVDDDEDDYLLARSLLSESRLGKFNLEWSAQYQKGRAALQGCAFDVALIDYDMGAASGINLIREAVAAGCTTPMILLTGRGDYEVDVQAMQAGAMDYLNKAEINPALLEHSIRYATERKRTEQDLQTMNNLLHQQKVALEKEQALLRAVLAQLPAAIEIAEPPSGRVILRNQQVEKIWRGALPPIEAPSETTTSLEERQFFPDGQRYTSAELPMARALRTGEVINEEDILVRRGDGSLGVFEVNAAPVRDAGGQIIAGVMVSQDITERQRAERDRQFLVELGEILNQDGSPGELLVVVCKKVVYHLEIVRCGFIEIDLAARQVRPQGEFTREPPPADRTYPMDDIQPEILSDLQHGRTVINRDAALDPRSAPGFDPNDRLTGLRSYIAVPHIAPPRAGCPGIWSSLMLIGDSRPRNWNGRQVAFLQAVAERTWSAFETRRLVTALRVNEENARANLQKLETVIDAMSEGVLLWDPYGGVIRINPAIIRQYGYSSEEEMRRDTPNMAQAFESRTAEGDLLAFDDLPHVRAARGETVINFEMQVHSTRDGRDWIGLYSSIPVRSRGGEILFVLDTVVDITATRLAEQRRREMDALVQMQHLLVEQREQERLQIARDLHDGPIQDLIGLTYTLHAAAAAAANCNNQPELARMLEGARSDAQKLVGELRGVCNELRPPMLSSFGLARAITAHVEELRIRAPQLAVRLDLDDDMGALHEEARLALYRIYRESLTNILRHANATQASVRLHIGAEQAALEIQDNGAGFTPPDNWLMLARQGHLGLVGIKERAEAIGGRLEIESAPGAGARVRVTLPRR